MSTNDRETDQDRAAIARIGGNVFRHDAGMVRARGYTREQTDEYMASEVQHKVNDRKASRRAQLPEAAFDWPIYRAAMTAEVYGALWGLTTAGGYAITARDNITESELRATEGDR